MITDKKILSYKQLAKKSLEIKKRGRKIVTITGTFDLFHCGHLLFLDFAKRQGDILIAGVGSDETVSALKGKSRPIIPEILRARLIAGLEVVDYVVILNEKMINKIDMWEFFKIMRPDVWVMPYKDHNDSGNKELAAMYSIKMVKNPRIKPNKVSFPLSTTYMEKKLKNL